MLRKKRQHVVKKARSRINDSQTLLVNIQEKLNIRLDYENLIFDYANEYAKTMMEQSHEERNPTEETTDETETE